MVTMNNFVKFILLFNGFNTDMVLKISVFDKLFCLILKVFVIFTIKAFARFLKKSQEFTCFLLLF